MPVQVRVMHANEVMVKAINEDYCVECSLSKREAVLLQSELNQALSTMTRLQNEEQSTSK